MLPKIFLLSTFSTIQYILYDKSEKEQIFKHIIITQWKQTLTAHVTCTTLFIFFHTKSRSAEKPNNKNNWHHHFYFICFGHCCFYSCICSFFRQYYFNFCNLISGAELKIAQRWLCESSGSAASHLVATQLKIMLQSASTTSV